MEYEPLGHGPVMLAILHASRVPYKRSAVAALILDSRAVTRCIEMNRTASA